MRRKLRLPVLGMYKILSLKKHFSLYRRFPAINIELDCET